MADKRVIVHWFVDRSAWLGLVIAAFDVQWAATNSVPWWVSGSVLGGAALLTGVSLDRQRAYRRQRDALQARIDEALELIATHDGPDAQFSEHWKWAEVREALANPGAVGE